MVSSWVGKYWGGGGRRAKQEWSQGFERRGGRCHGVIGDDSHIGWYGVLPLPFKYSNFRREMRVHSEAYKLQLLNVFVGLKGGGVVTLPYPIRAWYMSGICTYIKTTPPQTDHWFIVYGMAAKLADPRKTLRLHFHQTIWS